MRARLPMLSRRRGKASSAGDLGEIVAPEPQRSNVYVYDARDLLAAGHSEGDDLSRMPEKYGKDQLRVYNSTFRADALNGMPCVDVPGEFRLPFPLMRDHNPRWGYAGECSFIFIWRWTAASDGGVSDFFWYHGDGFGEERFMDFRAGGEWFFVTRYTTSSLQTGIAPSPDATQLLRHSFDNDSAEGSWDVYENGEKKGGKGSLPTDTIRGSGPTLFNRSGEATIQLGLMVAVRERTISDELVEALRADYFDYWAA